jgi:hypothetical protein
MMNGDCPFTEKKGFVETLVFVDILGGFTPPHCGSPQRDMKYVHLIIPSLNSIQDFL